MSTPRLTLFKKFTAISLLMLSMVVPTAQAVTIVVAPNITITQITPNPYDPATGLVKVYYNLTKAAGNVTIEICSGQVVCTGSNSFRTLLPTTSKAIADGYISTWDGEDTNNQQMSDGTYTMSIKASNAYGSDTEYAYITLDSGSTPAGTAPVISNDYATPNPFDPYIQDTSIYYDLNTTANVTITMSTGDTLLNSASKAAGTHSDTYWDGIDSNNNEYSEGTYTYTITATNSYGTDTETGTVTIDYTNNPSGTAPVISTDYASPNPFDPHVEDTTIYYDLNTTANVTITMSTGDTLLNSASKGAGTHSDTDWDGLNSSNNEYSEGTYTYTITATNSYGTDVETGSVTIDYDDDNNNNDAPTITNDRETPDPFDPADEDAKIIFTIDTSAEITVEIRDGSDTIKVLADEVNKASGTYTYYWDGEDEDNDMMDDGTYKYYIKATNSDGTDTATDSFRLESNSDDYSNDNTDGDFGDLIDNLIVTNSTFDPENDEKSKLCFDVQKDNVDLTIEVLDKNDKVVRKLVDDISYDKRDDNCVSWNGKDKSSDIVDDGTYTYRIKANKGSDKETAYIDTKVDSNGSSNKDDGDYGDLIDNIDIDNEVFDPSDDEKAKLCFDVEKDNVDITVEILDGSKVVRTLIDDHSYDQRNNLCTSWNGDDKSNDEMDDDVYRFRIEASKGSDDETAYAYVELDTDGHIIGFPSDDEDCGGFNDVDSDNPYCKAVKYLELEGVFDGYADGSFRPNQAISRAETAKVVLLANDIDILKTDGSDLGYWDVNEKAWYMPYLRTAQRLGIMRGYPDGSARPDETVNRVELLKIFLEATDAEMRDCRVAYFTDTPTRAWYNDYVCFAAQNDLMSGDSSGKFYPGSPMTRGDVAELFYQFYIKDGKFDYNYSSGYSSY